MCDMGSNGFRGDRRSSHKRKEQRDSQPFGLMISQTLYAKSSVCNICSIPIQAITAGKDTGIPLGLNSTVIKIAEVFNARRNMRFMKKNCDTVKVLMLGRFCHLQVFQCFMPM